MHTIKRINQKIKRTTNHAWRQTKELLHLNENFFKQARGSRIIVYHGICFKDHTKFNGIFLEKVAFEKHLQFYKKYFNVVSLNDFYKSSFDENKFNVCITFDDGYYNNYKYVLPLMEAYQMPMSFFVTAIRDAGYNILWNDFLQIATKYGPEKIYFQNEKFIKINSEYTSAATAKTLRSLLNENNFVLKYEMMNTLSEIISFKENKEDEDFWQQMDIPDIKRLAASPYATIGAHSYYHNVLSKLPIEDCKKELRAPKSFLENVCNKEIDAIAFPYGDYSKEVIIEAKKAGYHKLLALDFKFEENKTDNTMRERMIINPYISLINQMYAIVKGKYE